MRAKNTFEGGVITGLDPAKQAPNTLRYALNGRLIFNPNIPHGNVLLNDQEDGSTFFAQTLQGRTLAFCNERGTKSLVSVCSGYEIVAMVDLGSTALIISTTGSTGYGQIGILYLNSDLSGVTYKVIYDDHNDPNGDRLRIKASNEPGAIALDIDYVEENIYLKRVYFSDGYNQERCLNLQLFFQESRCADACESLNTLTPIHTPFAGSCFAVDPNNGRYPKHMSVHSMESRMDLVFPRNKFVTRIDGSLRRGAFQYAVRYISADGHKSVWSTITRHVLVTGTHYPQNPEYLHPVLAAPWNGNNGFSHHNRQMSSTDNESVTEDGLQIQLVGLDTRWDSFEVAYIYSKTELVPHEANVFYTHRSKCGTTPFSSTMVINHTGHTGYPIAFEELNQRYETLLSVQSSGAHNKKLYKLGAELIPDIQATNLSSATIVPSFKYLPADQTFEPNFVSKVNPKTGASDGDPITNSIPINTTVQLSNFTGSVENYVVNDDYLSYKGQQVEHLLAGYWRGETYGIGLMFRDRKGNPLFVQNIKDYTFPEQYYSHQGEPCSLTKLVNGKWELRVMGMRISGIRIPKKCLRDKFGKLNISGFEIVRTKRNKRILHQGIVYPVVNVGVGCDGEYKDMIRNKPSPFLKNKYDIPFSQQGDFHAISPDAQGNSHYMIRDDNQGSIFKRRNTIGERVVAYPGYCMYASPDVMFTGDYTFNPIDKIKHVGTCHKGYTQNEIPIIGSGFPTVNINKHNYCKSYDTTNPEGNLQLLQYGRPRLGSDSELKFGELMRDSWYEKLGIDPDRTDMTFRNGYLDVAIADQNAFDAPGSGTTAHKIAAGAGVRNTIFLGCKDFKHVDIQTPTSEVSYRIANYIRANSDYLSPNGENSFDSRKYQSTGHFQPITEAILAAAASDANDYIFNDIDVFGGDCYVGFFGFTRTQAQGQFNCGDQDAAVRFRGDLEVDSCNNVTGDENIGYKDYSYSMVVPLESSINIALRTGRIFESKATMPQEVYCENKFLQLSGGINDKQQESFDVNSVVLHQENLQFFAVKPAQITIVTSKPSSVYVSSLKTYSESDDSWRKQKVNDFYDLDGPGEGVALVKAFSYLYVFQKNSYGILRTNERAIVPTSAGEIILGTGKDLDGVDYLSKEIGCQHKSSILSHENAIYWVDAKRGLICRHSQAGREELSESKMVHDFTSKALDYYDNNLPAMIATGDRNIVSGINADTGDVLFTFHGENTAGGPPKSNLTKTLCFNEKLSIFHGFYQFYPSLYFHFKKVLLLVNSGKRNDLYVHNKGKYGHYFGEYKKTVMLLYMNDNVDYEKVLDVIKIQVDSVGQRRIGKVVINAQTSQHTLAYQQNNLFLDERFKYREDNLVFPAFQRGLNLTRLRDKFFSIRIEIDNQNQLLDNQDLPVSISSVYCDYRPSSRL